MIKDDMSDDAEFEAFLKGEGALARQLQSVAQPSPPPALDAAILAHARAALSDPAPGAANDGAPANDAAAGKWAPPPSLSWRWRVPAGLAAALLVGVIARQSFESDRGDLAVPAQVVYEQAPLPAAQAPAAPPPPASISSDVPAAAPPPPQVQAESRAAAPKAAPAPAPLARPVGRLEKSASASARADAAPAPVTKSRPMAAPPPAAAPASEPEKPSPESYNLERAETVTITGSSIRAATDAAPDAQARPVKPAAVAEFESSPKKAMRKAQAQQNSVNDMLVESGAALGRSAAPVAPAAVLLERVERLLDAGDRQAALEEWELLRRTYPEYPVPDVTREKLERIKP